jgi:hypothetical protein
MDALYLPLRSGEGETESGVSTGVGLFLEKMSLGVRQSHVTPWASAQHRKDRIEGVGRTRRKRGDADHCGILCRKVTMISGLWCLRSVLRAG